MENIPNESENYSINKDNKEYILTLSYSSSTIEIKIIQNGNFNKFSYEKIYSLNDLKKIANYFSLFNSISDIKPNIKEMISNEKTRDLELKENSKTVKLILFPPIMNIDKIILDIPRKDINKDEIIEELIASNTKLIKRVDLLEKELREIKEILQINNITRNIYPKIDSTIIYTNEENNFIIDCLGKRNLKFQKIYTMSKEGNELYEEFHKFCDNKGPTLCLFKIQNRDIRYGGFASVSWDSNSGEKRDENAFIFSVNNKKMFKSTNYNSSIFCKYNYGPFFGGNSDSSFAELWCCGKNSCGFYNNKIYKDSNKECTQGLYGFNLDELEVFQVINY